jgi:integrase
MSGDLTYDVRVYKTEVYRGVNVTTHRVRWKAGARLWRRSFRTAAQADSFRAELLASARRGEAFVTRTGLPASWQHTGPGTSWHEFACAYVDMKWKAASAKYRRAIAQALAAALPAMVEPATGQPPDEDIRRAVLGWGYNSRLRESAPPDAAAVLAWLSRHTKPVADLRRPADTRALLDTAVTRLDGTRAAATSARRHRAVLHNALEYAVELGLLEVNPVRELRWTTPRASHAIDRRRVINPDQARNLLAAVHAQQPSGPRLVAFFGAMYYCGLRPEEAVMLRAADLHLPADGGWGELHVSATAPDAGGHWTDSGSERDQRGLKHRGEGEIRTVPVPPPQVRLFHAHLEDFGTSADGYLFRGVAGGPLATITYRRAWDRARKAALTPAGYASPLARRPYDLRHACLSTWLNGGVAPAQVAEWAGNSVEVLLRTYARCLDGQHDIAKRRIMDALSGHPADDEELARDREPCDVGQRPDTGPQEDSNREDGGTSDSDEQ